MGSVKSSLRFFNTEDFADEYLQLEIVPTAELLTGTQEIDDVFYECFKGNDEQEGIQLEVVSFDIDECSFSDAVIAKYNQRIAIAA